MHRHSGIYGAVLPRRTLGSGGGSGAASAGPAAAGGVCCCAAPAAGPSCGAPCPCPCPCTCTCGCGKGCCCCWGCGCGWGCWGCWLGLRVLGDPPAPDHHREGGLRRVARARAGRAPLGRQQALRARTGLRVSFPIGTLQTAGAGHSCFMGG